MKYVYIIGEKDYKDLCDDLIARENIVVDSLGSGNKGVLSTIDVLEDIIKEQTKGAEMAKDMLDNKAYRTCPCCGTLSNKHFPDYRGSECVSKYNSCPICLGLEDKRYFKLMRESREKEDVVLDYL